MRGVQLRLTPSLALQVGAMFFDISIPVIKVMSLFPSALYFHFISQLVKNLGTGDIYWKLSNSHT